MERPASVSALSLESYLELYNALTANSAPGSSTVGPISAMESAWFKMKDLQLVRVCLCRGPREVHPRCTTLPRTPATPDPARQRTILCAVQVLQLHGLGEPSKPKKKAGAPIQRAQTHPPWRGARTCQPTLLDLAGHFCLHSTHSNTGAVVVRVPATLAGTLGRDAGYGALPTFAFYDTARKEQHKEQWALSERSPTSTGRSAAGRSSTGTKARLRRNARTQRHIQEPCDAPRTSCAAR